MLWWRNLWVEFTSLEEGVCIRCDECSDREAEDTENVPLEIGRLRDKLRRESKATSSFPHLVHCTSVHLFCNTKKRRLMVLCSELWSKHSRYTFLSVCISRGKLVLLLRLPIRFNTYVDAWQTRLVSPVLSWCWQTRPYTPARVVPVCPVRVCKI